MKGVAKCDRVSALSQVGVLDRFASIFGEAERGGFAAWACRRRARALPRNRRPFADAELRERPPQLK